MLNRALGLLELDVVLKQDAELGRVEIVLQPLRGVEKRKIRVADLVHAAACHDQHFADEPIGPRFFDIHGRHIVGGRLALPLDFELLTSPSSSLLPGLALLRSFQHYEADLLDGLPHRGLAVTDRKLDYFAWRLPARQ